MSYKEIIMDEDDSEMELSELKLEILFNGERVEYDCCDSCSDILTSIKSNKAFTYLTTIEGEHSFWIDGKQNTNKETFHYYVKSLSGIKLSNLQKIRNKLLSAEALQPDVCRANKQPLAYIDATDISHSTIETLTKEGYNFKFENGKGVWNDTYPGACGAGFNDRYEVTKPQ